MDPVQRIEALYQAGKITAEEAQMLREAVGGSTEAAQPAVPNPPVEPDPPAAPPLPEAAPLPVRLLRLEVKAGDVVVEGDPDLSDLQVMGQAEVVREGEVVRVSPRIPMRQGGGWVGQILGQVAVGALRLRIPAHWGVEVRGLAGDLKVQQVAWVKGHWAAGDVNLHQIKGVDLTMRAGDLEAELYLDQGKHRLSLNLGDLEVRLLPGSDVTVTAQVALGDLESRTFDHDARRLQGSLGAGQASLELSVTAGDLSVDAWK